MASYISQIKVGSATYDIKAKALTNEVIADLKKSAMVYKGPIKQADLDKLTNQKNGDVYTITDKENKEVVWYKASGATEGAWADLGYDDAHAHSVTLNGTEKAFDSNGKVNFDLSIMKNTGSGTAYNRISKSGSISDPTHTHALSGAPSLSTTSSEVAVSAPAEGETATYTPKGTVSAVSFTDYATGINGATYTPEGSLTGGSASIPANKVVTDVSVTSDAIKSVKINTSEVFDNIGLIYDVEANAKDVSVSGAIPKNSFLTDLTKNSAQDFTLKGTATTITASYTPSGSVGRSAKILASVSGETLTLTSSVQEATGTFTGTPATITSNSFTPSGKITIPSGTYAVSGVNNSSAVTINSTGSYTPSLTLAHFRPIEMGEGMSGKLFYATTEQASTTLTVTKNDSAISCSFTAPTFSGTQATITPTLKTGIRSVTPTFTGTGTMLKYTKATGATVGTLAVGKSSTGITHKDPTFNYADYITDIVNNPIKVDFPTNPTK